MTNPFTVHRPQRASYCAEMGIALMLVAILALITAPRFWEAETRSKISRARELLRVQASALETYELDHGAYPPGADAFRAGDPYSMPNFHARSPSYLTTPIAYLAALPPDPFLEESLFNGGTPPYTPDVGRRYVFWNTTGYTTSFGDPWNGLEAWTGAWTLYSVGPDQTPFQGPAGTLVPYDPTNGTFSPGNIIQTQKNALGINPHPVTGTFRWN